MPPREINCKLVLLGKESTGKSSLCKRFIQDEFERGHPVTVGASYAAKKVRLPLLHHKPAQYYLHRESTVSTSGYGTHVWGYCTDTTASVLLSSAMLADCNQQRAGGGECVGHGWRREV